MTTLTEEQILEIVGNQKSAQGIKSVVDDLLEKERREGEFSTLEYAQVRGLNNNTAYKELRRAEVAKLVTRRAVKNTQVIWWKYREGV